jgi:hypothetical protein
LISSYYCLIPKPAKLKNPETIGLFTLFAELISFHLNLVERMAFKEDPFLDKTMGLN